MRRPRRLLGALTAAAVFAGTGGIVWSLLSCRPHLTAESFERIAPGMTLAEVEAILGCPPGDYADSDECPMPDVPVPPGGRAVTWNADLASETTGPDRQSGREALAIRIDFDEEGRVTDARVVQFHYQPLSLSDRIHRWFRQVGARLGF